MVLATLTLRVLLAATAGSSVTSNVSRGDYAGSEACAPCHGDVFKAWQRSPMHRMTRDLPAAEVRAPFDGSAFTYKGDTLIFSTEGGERRVALSSPTGTHAYRVTRVIGGRYREDFVGVETGPGASPDEVILPASYVFSTRSLRPKGYSVMSTERPGLRAGPVWSQTCVDCHNTAPYVSVALGALLGRGAPGFQGEVVDPLLPEAQRWTYRVTDPPRFRDVIQRELAYLGAPGAEPTLAHAIEATRDRMTGKHLIEVGIGCESCHGGSREHVSNPALLPSYAPHTASWASDPPSGQVPSRALLVNRTCARCHQVLFTRYPYTWEGGSRSHDPGGSTINSGEARDFLSSRCAQALACTACHDPHAEDDKPALEALATPARNGVCTGCHASLADANALRAHAHHDPKGAGASCVGCHMPRKNMGLAYQLTRYHRLGSPADPQRVEHDRPLECALCHPRATPNQLLSDLERWWGKRYDRKALRVLYGDLDTPVLRATLERGRPHEQVVAALRLADEHDSAAVPAMAQLLVQPYPLVRYDAKAALERTLGAPIPVDPDAELPELRKQLDAWASGGYAPLGRIPAAR